MAAIRQALQRDVFTARDERLLGVVHVTKNKSKSKKNNFLCLAVTSEQPVQVSVSVVKKGARSDELYKRHIQWLLTDLKQVEASQNPTEFDLVFDKLYRWEAASESERENFLMNLVKLAKRYLSPTQLSNIAFSNINVSAPDRSQAQSDDLSDARIADYQELSDVEQTDLGDILQNCEGALQNAEAFAELLQGNLSSLDGDNMTAIMKSDSDIKDLMKTLDQAINEVVRVESELERYDAMLGSIQTQMGAMKSQQSFIQISDLNQRCLISEIASIVDQLEMPKEHQKALRDADLDSSDGIKMEPQLEICDTFEVPSDVTDPVSFMDLEFMIAKMEHLNEVTDQEIVGWYTTSNHSVSQHDLTQSKMVDTKCGDTRMLMMKVDPFNDTAPAVIYEFLETENCLEQREFCMETQDEERIGMDRILGDGLSDRSMSAAERVLEKVKILRNYLEAVASGELEGDVDLIRQAESILSHPPYALPEIMDKHEDDAYMIRTLTDVTLSSQSLHQYVQMDNGLIKRGGTGQVSGKWRGQKIVYNEHL